MHGWEDLAQNVSKASLTIPAPERETTVAFVSNYGEAGALELLASRYPLPRVICNHNWYWFWGVGPTPITTFIRLGGNREQVLESYGDVTRRRSYVRALHAVREQPRCFHRAQPPVPIDKAWPEYKHFE